MAKVMNPSKYTDYEMLNRYLHDPVFFSNGQYGFWIETWADFLYPYKSEDSCREALSQYVEWL
jgi:hypothetical protein